MTGPLRPRVRRLFRLSVRRPERAAAEMDDEIRVHLELRAAQLVARGWSSEAAMAESQRRFGATPEMRRSLRTAARRREEVLTMRDRLDALRHDFEHALRQIMRAPGLAAAVTVTFALGIGANATMVGIIDRLLLRPPAHVAAPERLAGVEMTLKFLDGQSSTTPMFSYPMYLDFRDRVPAFSSVAAYAFSNRISLGVGASARKASGLFVSGSYFGTLGVPMAVGRAILPEDDLLPNGSPVAVIGYGLWLRDFGGASDAVGKTIALGQHRFTVIGVTPKEFTGTSQRPIDVWVPITAAEGLQFPGKGWATDRQSRWLSVVGRIAPGAGVAIAEAQVTAVYRAAARGQVDSAAVSHVTSVLPSRGQKLSPGLRVAALLAGVSVLVLLIACANIANLLLVRAFSRRREIALRLALGISRSRLVRQLVTEAVVLAVSGGLAAIPVVYWGTALVQHLLLRGYAYPDSPFDGRAVAFTSLATFAVGLVTGLVPALQGSDPDLARTLRESTRGSGLRRSQTRAALLIVQGAVSVVLLIGAGLFMRTLREVNGVRFGIDVDRLLIATIDLRSVGIDGTAADNYYIRTREIVSRLPGVASVTLADAAPFGDRSVSVDVFVPGRDSLPKAMGVPFESVVPPNYFATVGTRIVRGRAFVESDAVPNASPVVVVNEAMARWLWQHESAIGRCLRMGATEPCAEIVGIAENAHRSTIAQDADPLQIYSPLGRAKTDVRGRMLVVRPVGRDPDALIEPVRRVMQTAVAGVPFANVRPMRSVLDNERGPWEIGATMFAAFGGIALVLSALGLYTIVSYTVAQRMHEMGVRLALGAQGRDVRRLVLAQGLRIAALGVAGGTTIALVTSPLVAPLLFQTSPRDPVIYGGVIGLLLLVAMVASLGPAGRAVRADPLVALRSE